MLVCVSVCGCWYECVSVSVLVGVGVGVVMSYVMHVGVSVWM